MKNKITLIAPPRYSVGKVSFISQNLGLGYIAACLESKGCRVQIIDAVAEGINDSAEIYSYGRKISQIGLSYKDIAERIDSDTELIGITVPFTMFANIAKDLVSVIKDEYPNIPIVLGGVYPSTLPQDALAENVDYIVQGEGEIPMMQLAEGIDPNTIKGLMFREGGKIINNGKAEIFVNLDEIPFPARHLLPMEKYISFSTRGRHNKRAISLITSRGCTFDCNFCSIHAVFGYCWRYRSPENVLKEIEHLINTYNLGHIEFEDDNITLKKDRALQIFDNIIKLNKDLKNKITWSCSNGIRVDTLDKEMLVKMKKSGCISLELAVESGDPKILKNMNKKMDNLEKITEVARVCAELELPTMAYMIVGYPGETEESFLKSLRYFLKLKKIGVSDFAVHLIKAYPATKLFEQCKEKGYLVDTELTHTRNLEGGPILSRKYVNIVTPDFTAKDIIRRRNYALKKLKPEEYYSTRFPKLYSFYKKNLSKVKWKLKK